MCLLSLLIVFYEYLILMLGPLIIYSIRYGMQYRFMYSNEMNERDSMIAVVDVSLYCVNAGLIILLFISLVSLIPINWFCSYIKNNRRS